MREERWTKDERTQPYSPIIAAHGPKTKDRAGLLNGARKKRRLNEELMKREQKGLGMSKEEYHWRPAVCGRWLTGKTNS